MLNDVFSKSESVSTMLQSPKLSLSNANSIVDALSALLTAQRNDDISRELWLEISTDALNIGTDQPVLPDTEFKVHRRIDGNAPSHTDGLMELLKISTEEFTIQVLTLLFVV